MACPFTKFEWFKTKKLNTLYCFQTSDRFSNTMVSYEKFCRQMFQLVPCTSRNLCGFLNSGWGGTVYIGILDGGSVQGVRLTQYQQDHLSLSLQDAMNAFRPPVPHFMYNTEFIPVLEPQDEYPCQLYVHNTQLFCL